MHNFLERSKSEKFEKGINELFSSIGEKAYQLEELQEQNQGNFDMFCSEKRSREREERKSKELEGEIERLKRKIFKQQEENRELEKANNLLANNKKEIELNYESCKTSNKEREVKIQNLKKKNNDLSHSLGVRDNLIDALEKEEKKLKKENKILNKGIGEKEKSLQKLEKEVEALEEENNSLKGK